MVGYVEQLTDPSYKGQAVCMTYPLIGNYGVNLSDCESQKIQVSGYIAREFSRLSSNFRNEKTIQDFLYENDIPAIVGIDTRALTLILRESGTMNGIITTDENYDLNALIPRIKAYRVGNVVMAASCKKREFRPGIKQLKDNATPAGMAVYSGDHCVDWRQPS